MLRTKLWETVAGFAARADMTGQSDRRDKSGYWETREEAVAVVQANGIFD